MNPQQPSRRLLILAIFVVVALQVIWLFLVLNLDFGANPLKGNMTSRGQFGDLFGGVNALFTGLAFAGLLFTIALQRYDLRTQGDDLRKSARLSAMATLADIYTRQIDVMERGGFRSELWEAERKIHDLAREEFGGLGNEEARDEVMTNRDRYIDCIDKPNNPLFVPSFEVWRDHRRNLDRLLSELKGIMEEQEEAPSESA